LISSPFFVKKFPLCLLTNYLETAKALIDLPLVEKEDFYQLAFKVTPLKLHQFKAKIETIKNNPRATGILLSIRLR